MDTRVFGLRNTYTVVCSAGLSPEEAAARLFGPLMSGGQASSVLFRNGGRVRLDVVGHPEYAAPDCGDVPDLVVHDKAGERILEGLLVDARRRMAEEGIYGDISVFKNVADPTGSSAGCREDYLVARRARFGRLADILIPFLVTRQLICGAGAVIQTPRGAMYCLSQQAGHIHSGISPAATRAGPLINTRDEPRTAATGLRRLHVMVSDPNMSETTTLFKAGATDLVLRMVEAATVLPDLTLDNPIQAIAEIGRDITGRSRVRLANGREMTALDIQREYLAKARDFADSRGADVNSYRVLDMWQRVLEAIGAGNLDAVAREIDWVTKYQLIERYRAASDLPLSAPKVAQTDLAYHDIHRDHSLYYQLQRADAVDRTAREIDIFEVKTVPPPPNRYRQAG